MRWDHNMSRFAGSAMREPIFNAMDELRLALDRAVEIGDDRIASLLLLSLHDLADTLEVTIDETAGEPAVSWTVSDKELR